MQYKLINHTADFGIHVFGKDEKQLFEHAALAMFELIIESGSPGACRQRLVSVMGNDWPDLMVNWLRELLYFWSGKEMLVKGTEILNISENELRAKIRTDAYDPDRHTIKAEIKAVTYHQIQVSEGPAGWEAKIIFDV